MYLTTGARRPSSHGLGVGVIIAVLSCLTICSCWMTILCEFWCCFVLAWLAKVKQIIELTPTIDLYLLSKFDVLVLIQISCFWESSSINFIFTPDFMNQSFSRMKGILPLEWNQIILSDEQNESIYPNIALQWSSLY